MGINLVWICDDCKEFDVSMRGEESTDFQYLARKHSQCFAGFAVRVQLDMNFDPSKLEELGYNYMWEYESRPTVTREEWRNI